ncbi:MAG: chemoreceptor glutamine deamidase CheD [Gammaproteobacteria bacterium]|nr:chemoreceptor glutamine deamidase CheD [Gammaproteobacteria bacterium]MDH5591684.1 chemoreceptor glutamine deamidase CheD [Gammaproteobacteria bacterium]
MAGERPPQPPCLPDFVHVNRYWDRTHKTWSAKILPGEYYVTIQPDEAVATTLGSCVSACIRDKVFGIGGMNHFMLPQKSEHGSDDWMDSATRYGSYAMEHLINDILKNGGNRNNLEVKLTGGGKIMANMSDVGSRNIEFVLEYLNTENLDVEVQDLGDIYPRKVLYFPATGILRVKRLRTMHNDTLIEREKAYQHELDVQPDSGGVELF